MEGHYYLYEIKTHQIQPLYQKTLNHYKGTIAFEGSTWASTAIGIAAMILGATPVGLPLLIASGIASIPALLIFGYEYAQLNHLKDAPEHQLLIVLEKTKTGMTAKYFCDLDSSDIVLHRVHKGIHIEPVEVDDKKYLRFSQKTYTAGPAIADVLLQREPVDLGDTFEDTLQPGFKGLFRIKTKKFSVADKINSVNKDGDIQIKVSAYTKKGGKRNKTRRRR